MSHPTTLSGMNATELGQELAGLRYDALEEFMRSLAIQLACDSVKDHEAGHPHLAGHLFQASEYAGLVAGRIGRAWAIASKHEVY